MDLDWGQIINGGAGLVSLYLATQIRLVVKNHEHRIKTLEEKPRRRAPRRKS